MPEGHFLAIVARSSLPKRGLIVANGLGVLDSDYRGPADEARVLVLNYTDAPVTVARGDRIAQAFVLQSAAGRLRAPHPRGRRRLARRLRLDGHVNKGTRENEIVRRANQRDEYQGNRAKYARQPARPRIVLSLGPLCFALVP